jgi:hypothetical protein
MASSVFILLVSTGLNAENSPLTCNPPQLLFGDVQVGHKRSLTAVITNHGAQSVTLLRGEETGAGFSTHGISFPLILQPGESFTFNVSFKPEGVGTVDGNLSTGIADDTLLNIPLAGAGTEAGQLVSSPPTLDFGNVRVGDSSQRSGKLSAVGQSVTVYSARSNNVEFSSPGLSFPLTIGAGESIPYQVTFRPKSKGVAAGTLSFRSNATDSIDPQVLEGDGLPEETYTVSLSWQGSKSQVVGYNIYRGTQSGGPYSMINVGLDPNTTYLDNTAMGGQTYYYVTTAVNSEGQESSYSNQAEAQVP